MPDIRCEVDASLTPREKAVFQKHLARERLGANVWDLFDLWAARSPPQLRFIYLKAYRGGELIGLALVVRVKPVDLSASYASLRSNAVLRRLAGAVSALSSNCAYLSFRNLITSNLTRPFFFRDPEETEKVMEAFLAFLKAREDANLVILVDTTACDSAYGAQGFARFPASSEAYLDVRSYRDSADYLARHPSLRKNLRRRARAVGTEIRRGPLSLAEINEVRECVKCSIRYSMVNTPGQGFFQDNIFGTEVFNSDKYLHVFVRVQDRIAGFHTFHLCGSHMGGILGGFDREYSRNNFLYERVIVGSVDYAIAEGISWVHYSLIDNQTKARLVESREPSALYFFARRAIDRKLFEATYRFGDVYKMSLLEKSLESA